ncbi:MAG: hypothetical protein N5P05_000991 [Chroococcopsis gigantea SAG 12.99]|jgi:hypothetical protein|nr:Uma2 family endonuclease [Chlorogloea purpurea SAG 13.99]MDV2999385.1 hypothetical protein [Chroococcopsis gigantea SAG 12.99]
MLKTTIPLTISWDKLPEDYILPDDPVDNVNQPALAAALTESLLLAGKLGDRSFTSTNYGICATVNGKTVVKAPDWAYVAEITVDRQEIIRSYTPNLQGQTPLIVMEFLSDTEGTEYSIKPSYPPGKWFFYEQVLQVPYYVIFNPGNGVLEVYNLNLEKEGRYDPLSPDDNGRYFIRGLDLFLGVWSGVRENKNPYWLRWWDSAGEMLLWPEETVEQQRQSVERARLQAEEARLQAEEARLQAEEARLQAEEARLQVQRERDRAERFLEQLRQAGLEPGGLADET